jgi:hypothetical protein
MWIGERQEKWGSGNWIGCLRIRGFSLVGHGLELCCKGKKNLKTKGSSSVWGSECGV